MRNIEIDGVFNVRDLGGYPTVSGGRTRWRVVLRADGIHRLTGHAAGAIAALGVSRVVDLRSAGEREEHGVFAHADVDVHHVPVLETVWSRAGEVPTADEEFLARMYREMLAERGALLARAATTVAEAPGPVVFHCSAGKDRTGVLAALLLSLVGVADDVIAADYAESHAAMERMIEALRAARRAAGEELDPLPDDVMHLMSARPTTMLATLDVLRAEHGGAETYLRAHGVTAEAVAALRDRLATSPAQPR